MKNRSTHLALSIMAMVVFSTAYAQESKVDTPPSGGHAPVTDGTSNVDAFGYEVNSCTNTFFDISTTGTSIVTGDDETSPLQPLNTTFNLYGEDVNALAMISNGFLSTTDDSGGDLSNDCPLPSSPSTGTGARIYVLQDDLVLPNGYFEYFNTCPVPSPEFPGLSLGCHIFQWDEAEHFGGVDAFDFQAVLFDDSYEIVFIHGTGNSEAGSGSTTGLQNMDASIGLTFACDTAASIPDNSSQCISHPQPNITDISVSVSDSVDPVFPGDPVTYTVTVDNNGPGMAENVVVNTTIPAGLTVVSTSGCAEDPAGSATCSLGTIADGSQAQFTIMATVDAGASGTLSVMSTVASDEFDTDAMNNSATETTSVGTFNADLSINKVASVSNVVSGDSFSYTITVSNLGPDAADNVVVNDVLPAGLTLVSTSGCSQDPNGVPMCGLGTIASGANDSFTINVTANVGVTGAITNTAMVSSDTTDPVAGNNSDSAMVQVDAPMADLQLSIFSNTMGEVNPGDNLGFTLNLLNAGPQDASNVQTQVNLPSNVSFVSSAGNCASASGQTLNWSLMNLANADMADCDFVVTVNFGTEVVITASTTSDTSDPVGGNNTNIVNGSVSVQPLVVPTLQGFGLMLLALSLLVAGVWRSRQYLQ
jgi:uncharacterized repeat protein (TIGR01451 family)